MKDICIASTDAVPTMANSGGVCKMDAKAVIKTNSKWCLQRVPQQLTQASTLSRRCSCERNPDNNATACWARNDINFNYNHTT